MTNIWEQIKEERIERIEEELEESGYVIFDADTTLDDYITRLETVIKIVEGSFPLDSERLKTLPGCNRNLSSSYPLSTLDKVLTRKEAYYGKGLLSEKDRRSEIAKIIAWASANVQDNYGIMIVGENEDFYDTLLQRLKCETDFDKIYELVYKCFDEESKVQVLRPKNGERLDVQINSYMSDPLNCVRIVTHAGPIENICRHLIIFANYVEELDLKAHFGGARKGGPDVGVLYEPGK